MKMLFIYLLCRFSVKFTYIVFVPVSLAGDESCIVAGSVQILLVYPDSSTHVLYQDISSCIRIDLSVCGYKRIHGSSAYQRNITLAKHTVHGSDHTCIITRAYIYTYRILWISRNSRDIFLKSRYIMDRHGAGISHNACCRLYSWQGNNTYSALLNRLSVKMSCSPDTRNIRVQFRQFLHMCFKLLSVGDQDKRIRIGYSL